MKTYILITFASLLILPLTGVAQTKDAKRLAMKKQETENSVDETVVEGEFDVKMASQESTDKSERSVKCILRARLDLRDLFPLFMKESSNGIYQTRSAG